MARHCPAPWRAELLSLYLVQPEGEVAEAQGVSLAGCPPSHSSPCRLTASHAVRPLLPAATLLGLPASVPPLHC